MPSAIVIGTGGVGSAAAFHLAKRGARVLGLDRFTAAHDRGSSHGGTRINRQALFEHPDYVPLAVRSYELWDQLAERAARQLYHEVGLVQIGPPDGAVVPGVLKASAEHNLSVDALSADEVHAAWPGFHVPEGYAAAFERRAGFLMVEDCVRAHLDAARDYGADLRSGVEVHHWSADGQGVRVETDKGTFTADHLVITAGPWASQLLAELDLHLEVRRKPLYWYSCDDPRYEATAPCPAFLFELPTGVFYGFPKIDPLGVKVADHSGGPVVADPLTVSRDVDIADRQRVETFIAAHLPGVSRQMNDHTTCMYTMSADEHFILDRHPQHPQVVFAAGLSGHGFKFTPSLGEALADLTLSGTTDLAIGFFSIDRPGLHRDPPQ